MTDESAPDSTAARVALWRALHVECDAPPHVLEDTIGLRLVAPEEGWRQQPDMSKDGTRAFRASVVARARFAEDLIVEQAGRGVDQYVLLGAGLDSFAQRRPEVAAGLCVFEIDRPGTQAWKRRRLIEEGFGIADWLTFVPVDFEAGASWPAELARAGFDPADPAVVASTGVSMYLSREAIAATLREAAAFAPGSIFAMTFIWPPDFAEPGVRLGLERAIQGAKMAGTPFLSFFTPDEIVALARGAGFRKVQHVAAAALAERYFANRTDGLRPPDRAEDFLLATV